MFCYFHLELPLTVILGHVRHMTKSCKRFCGYMEMTYRCIRSETKLMDVNTKKVFTDALRFIYVQMPLAKKTEAECENDFDYLHYP